jgi:polyvinyl alcohol dehydrogenase (cytochrome)
MEAMRLFTGVLAIAMALLPFTAAADSAGSGADLFKAHCSHCHSGFLGSRAPSPQVLAKFPPQSIVHALTTGIMRVQGAELTGEQRRSIAVFLTNKPFDTSLRATSRGHCTQSSPMADPTHQSAWNGWGASSANTSFQTAQAAGLTADRVPQLKLQWAFGFPDSYSAWSQPVVGAGRLFVGSQAGVFYSLDAKTGCTYWSFEAQAGIRGAASLGPVANGSRAKFAVFFGDLSGNAYALNAETGELLWTTEVDKHPKARVTGSPTLYRGRLYVPMSSWTTVNEEDGECCDFRGSLSALDANTGKIIWKTYTIPEEPKRLAKKNRSGAPLWGPSGSALWSSPTIDPKRSVVYVGSGNSYTGPAVNSDSIIAFDLDTGAIQWSRQVTPNDVWLAGCAPDSAPPCSYQSGVNFDFGVAPMLAKAPDGRELLIVGQKSGVAFALNPDKQGEIVWQYRASAGGTGGGIVWGSAVDPKLAYFPVSDITAQPGGLHAVDLATGKRIWYAPPRPLLCGVERYGCSAAQPVGIAVIPGIVFAGAADGGFRAYSARTGEVVWEYDTNHDFETVNGIPANGGSLIGSGPTVVDGMVYVNSGYGTNGGRVGNVLLAFAAKQPGLLTEARK